MTFSCFHPANHIFSKTFFTVKPSNQENFEGPAVIVPDLEGVLFLKEDGKKIWRPRYFLLRASGIYFVPKGKSKVYENGSIVCVTGT